MSSKLKVIVGGQFGSEGKGSVAAALATRAGDNLLALRVAGPNAGHCVIGRYGESADMLCEPYEGNWKWKLRCVPVAAVVNPDAELGLAAGSEIDFDVLRREVELLDRHGYGVGDRLTIDPAATVINQRHRAAESARALTDRIGSTGKGIGAARADRIWREALTVRDLDCKQRLDLRVARLGSDVWGHDEVHIEGTQGYGLGLHTDYYPQVTSSDTRAIDFLAMAGISPWDREVEELEVWVALRTRPIRVAGNSGPLTAETSWEAEGLEPERTTVTNKIRRVGQWDPGLANAALDSNGRGPALRVALTMADQVWPQLSGRTGNLHDLLAKLEAGAQIADWISGLTGQLNIHRFDYVGTGPDTYLGVNL